MSNNELRYTTNNGVIYNQYKKALKFEQCGDYNSAIKLYKLNIKKYNHSASKVRLAQLYLEGKTKKIKNDFARKLLEGAYKQGDLGARPLLAYTYSNGIGGEKRETEAYAMFKEELKNGNPDSMVYIELLKLMPKDNKELRKSFNKIVTNTEKIMYKRKVSIDKFNNTKLGRIANFIPNMAYRFFEYSIEDKKNRKIKYSLGDLYDRAKEYENKGDEKTARRIYKRLTNYGDKDASLKYARMLILGIGGPKDIESAKNIYYDIIEKSNNKLERINHKIYDLDSFLKKNENLDEKQTRKSKKENKIIKEEIDELLEKRGKVLTDNIYNEACLKYGLLLVDYPRNKNEFNEGISLLKSFSDKGDYIPEKGQRISKVGEKANKRVQIAASKLGRLYELGKWKPENLEEERLNFLKFSSGKNVQYVSHISERMLNEFEDIEENIESVPLKQSKVKECKIRYELGTLCEYLHLNTFARKIFSSMSQKGDYRCSYALGRLEQKGKGGKIDNESAKRHYREYIQNLANKNKIDSIAEQNRFMAVNNIAEILLEEKDIRGAVELYKISAKSGVKKAKQALRALNEDGLWSPETEMEADWIKQRGISKAIGFIKSKMANIPEIIATSNIKYKAKQALATSVVLATVASTTSYAMSNNISNVSAEGSSYVDENSDRSYSIGDEVLIGEENFMEAQIIGLVAYNIDSNQIIKNKNFNFNNFGLNGEDYIEEITKTQHVDKDKLKIAYCIQNGDHITWISPEKEKLRILKSYIAKKKEEDIRELM